jgi:ATP-dependent RNA helicase DeaD
VHRCGRSGRAGRAGRAITFVAGREIYKLQSIIRFTKGNIRRERVPTESEVEEKKANAFFEALQSALEQGTFKRQDALIERLLDQNHSPTDIASAVIHLYQEQISKSSPPPAAVPDRQAERFPPREERREPRRSGPRFEERRPRPERGPEESRFQPRPAPPRRETPGPGSLQAKSDPLPPKPRKERDAPAAGMARIVLGVGSDHGAKSGDVLGVILKAAALPNEDVGAIQIKGKQSLVDVRRESADLVVQKLTGFKFKNRMLWCKKC